MLVNIVPTTESISGPIRLQGKHLWLLRPVQRPCEKLGGIPSACERFRGLSPAGAQAVTPPLDGPARCAGDEGMLNSQHATFL